VSLRKIRTREAMRKERDGLHAMGRKLVFTNGCFDILHPGHLRYLSEARALGDCLVVAVNADETVGKLKGKERPLTPLLERMEVLAALGSVDYVVGFEEETPAAVIEAILPDVLVKGGDWTKDKIVGRDTMEQAGGRVYSLPFAPGHSSSGIIERIVARLSQRPQ
jgi:rfaE bifunctional protein nucleotidyltransferase chain/domain